MGRLGRFVGVALVLGLGLSGCFRNPWAAQRERARSYLPAPLAGVDAAAEAKVRLRARVRVAPGLRSLLGWKTSFERALADANAVLAAAAGLEIEVVSYAPWPTAPGASADTGALLRALFAADSGERVDLVIGLASPLSIHTSSMEALGRALRPGRHLVLRSFESPAEHDAFGRAFGLVSEEEVREILKKRKRHRDAAVLLHELAHSAGAGHAEGKGLIMASQYHREASLLDPEAVAALRRLAERVEAPAPAAEPARAAKSAGAAGREPRPPEPRTPEARLRAAREAIEARALERAATAVAGLPGREACGLRHRLEGLRHRLPAEDVPLEDRAELRRLLEAAVAPGRRAHRERATRLEALSARFDGSHAERVARCFAAVERREDGVERCREAIRENDEAALAHLLLGIALQGRRDRDGAVEALARAAVLDPELKQAWRRLAGLLPGPNGERVRAELRRRARASCPAPRSE